LKRQYLSRGHYAVQLTTTVTPLERNRVGISFSVDEGEIAKIKQINVIGATAFKEKELLDLFVLRTPNWLSWYTKNDQYSKQKLSGDLESLRSFYLNRGYLEFNVESTQVSISPDKQDIYITINISEGAQYSVSSVKLAGELLLPEEELIKLVKVAPGEMYSRERLTESTKAIADRLGNDGYAFANVNAAPELDKEKRQVAFTIYVDPGRRAYVRRINVTGNSRSRDEVVRREMRQMESSWYDGEKINRSRTRVDRLGYFEEVTLETPAVPGTTDQVDVNVNVKEKATGALMLGLGFSSSEKLVLSGSVQQQNMFGSGNFVGIGVNSSKSNTVYSFSYTDPYYTVDGVSRGFDFYHRNYDTSSLATIATYGAKSTGGGVRFGVPISEDDTVNFGLALDQQSAALPGLCRRERQLIQQRGRLDRLVQGHHRQPSLSHQGLHSQAWRRGGGSRWRSALLQAELPDSALPDLVGQLHAGAERRVRLCRWLRQEVVAVFQELLCWWHWLGTWLRQRFARPARLDHRRIARRQSPGGRRRRVAVSDAWHGAGQVAARRRVRRHRAGLGRRRENEGG